MQLSDMQYLMHQLGPAMTEVSVILQEEIDSWQVLFNDDIGVQISWQTEPPRVLISGALGEVPEGARERVYAGLLIANSLPSSTLGLTCSLGLPDEQVLVLAEIEASALSVDDLADRLREFLHQAVEVSAFIADSAHAIAYSAADDISDEPVPQQLV